MTLCCKTNWVAFQVVSKNWRCFSKKTFMHSPSAFGSENPEDRICTASICYVSLMALFGMTSTLLWVCSTFFCHCRFRYPWTVGCNVCLPSGVSGLFTDMRRSAEGLKKHLHLILCIPSLYCTVFSPLHLLAQLYWDVLLVLRNWIITPI